MPQPSRLAALYLGSFLLTGGILLGLAPREPAAPAATAHLAAPASAPAPDWLPPAWVPGTDALSVPGLDQPGPSTGLRVGSRAAMVYDLDRQEVLFEQRADSLRPVASLTKMVASLAYASLEPDLEHVACIDAEQRPTRSGARSRLSTGDCSSGWDLVGAALVASDNRAAYALAAAAQVGVDDLIVRMNEVSADLGMSRSQWADPSGLEDENLSTARDMTKALITLSSVPALALAASAPSWELHRDPHPVRRLGSTNKLLYGDRVIVEAGKTGYTDTAGYCLSTIVQTRSGQRLAITLLGARRERTRWSDVARIVQWAEAHDDQDALADGQ